MANESDSSLSRMLRVLDIIEDGPMVMSAEALHEALGFSRSTLYRYLKILSDSGLLSSLPDVGYTLGPRVTELDYKMRLRDPLIASARPVMTELVGAVPGVSLLCRRYRYRVLCVHQERSGVDFESRYERGQPRPLLRGAASLAILAHMPSASIARLYDQDSAAFGAAGLGETLANIRDHLSKIRRAGWCASEGQLSPDTTGIAAAILDGRGSVVGSLSITLGRRNLPGAEIRSIAARVMDSAAVVGQSIRSEIL